MELDSGLFLVDPNNGVAIYRQIVEQVQALVAGGRLKPGRMLPSVRSVAAELAVNPMTVSKAYAQLETLGVIERVRGMGMRISATAGATLTQRTEQLRTLLDPAMERARQLGLNDRQILQAVRQSLKESNHEPLRH